MSMMCRPKWPFLLMCMFHDVRHVEFRELMGSQWTPRVWGVTDLTHRLRGLCRVVELAKVSYWAPSAEALLAI